MSPEHETRNRAFYDHEDEEPRSRGRRRRPVADWGVEEDVFDRMPSRRFARRGEEPRSISRTIVIERAPAPEPLDEREPTTRAVEPAPRAFERPPREVERAPEPRAYDPEPPAEPAGRRTVVIAGRPDRLPVSRNRPPRTAVERIGPRPDRIVAYSVALGFLLILIAILTSH